MHLCRRSAPRTRNSNAGVNRACAAQLPLLVSCGQLNHVPLFHIAQHVFRFDKVDTGVVITVMLSCSGIATYLRKNTWCWWRSIPGGQRCIEHLHKDGDDITADPFIEDRDQKGAPLFRLHRALEDLVALLKADLALFIDTIDNRHEDQCLYVH
jgi:hypothetical protein